MAKPKKLRIQSDEELRKLIESVASDCQVAHIRYKLYNDLRGATSEFAKEMNESRAFWGETLNSLLDSALLHLSRLYDDHTCALGLPRLLETMREYRHFFDEPSFRERMKDNKFVENLAARCSEFDPKRIQADVADVSDADPAVKKLRRLRNEVIAHRDPRLALNHMPYPGLTRGEIELLLNRCLEIINHYSALFHAAHYSPSMIGNDDYMSVLRFVRGGIEAHESRIREECRRADEPDPSDP